MSACCVGQLAALVSMAATWLVLEPSWRPASQAVLGPPCLSCNDNAKNNFRWLAGERASLNQLLLVLLLLLLVVLIVVVILSGLARFVCRSSESTGGRPQVAPAEAIQFC